MFRAFKVAVAAATLFGGLLVFTAHADSPTYTPYPGQSITVTGSLSVLGAPNVNIQLAELTGLTPPTLVVTAFGMNYRIDFSSSLIWDVNRQPTQVTGWVLGNHINVYGTLDPNDRNVVHASIVRNVGGSGSGIPAPGGWAGATTGGGNIGGSGAGGGAAGGNPALVTYCTSGGQVANSGGEEGPLGTAVVGLVRQALGCPSSWPFTQPGGVIRSGDTPNHRLLSQVYYYGWAMRAGSDSDKTDARNLLVGFLNNQTSGGHYLNEALTTSHYEIWINGIMAARLLAFVNKDQALLDATGKWLRQEFVLYGLLYRDGSVYSPGLRSVDLPNSQLRDVIYLMVSNKAPLPSTSGANGPGGPGVATSNWWNDYYNVGAWTLRDLLQLGDDLGGAAKATKASDPVVLNDPLCLYVKGNDFVYVFPKFTTGIDPLFWVASIGGKLTYSPAFTGATPASNPFAPPALSGATLTVIPGVNGDTSGCTSAGPPGPAGAPQSS